jgi:hypothetical protein
MKRILTRLMAIVVVLGLFVPVGRAADHLNLEEGLPVQIEDAYPIGFMGREIQGLARYEHADDGTDTVTFRPVLEWGVFRNAQVAVESDLIAGNGDRTGSGNVAVHGLYNFNTETLSWPALAIKGGLEFPTGKSAEGVDTTLKFIATRTIGRSLDSLDRIHFNAAWMHNAKSHDDERDDHYMLGLGYSRRIDADAILVADYIFEQEREEDTDIHLVELGVRYQCTPLMVLAAGVGAGIAEDSPDIRVTFAFQKSF